MTPKQLEHLAKIHDDFTKLSAAKYSAGAKEHGGNLWEKGILFLVEQAILENVDQFIYLTTLRDELVHIKDKLPKPTAVDTDKL